MSKSVHKEARIRRLNETIEEVLQRIADKNQIPVQKLKQSLKEHGDQRRIANDWRLNNE